MSRMYHITDEFDERGGSEMLERAFEEGCKHGYKKALRELEGGYGERSGHVGYRTNYREGFEEKLEKLKRMYK